VLCDFLSHPTHHSGWQQLDGYAQASVQASGASREPAGATSAGPSSPGQRTASAGRGASLEGDLKRLYVAVTRAMQVGQLERTARSSRIARSGLRCSWPRLAARSRLVRMPVRWPPTRENLAHFFTRDRALTSRRGVGDVGLLAGGWVVVVVVVRAAATAQYRDRPVPRPHSHCPAPQPPPPSLLRTAGPDHCGELA
jgi:hypothetical protein